MRRLPGILLLTGVGLVVLAALLVSGLRLVLPHINDWRPAILQKIENMTGMPVQADHIDASWQNFGPTLEVDNIAVDLKTYGDLRIGRVTLGLDLWQSLLHWRWQFRDLTFYQLHMRTDVSLNGQEDDGEGIPANRITDLFFRQFDHFDLRDSTFSFLTLSGQRAELSVPQLTWVNNQNRHRAEGIVSLSSFNGQHGVANVRLDLRDENGLLDRGKIWLQADDVDLQPWMGRWMKSHLDLKRARFSLEGWMDIRAGEIDGGDIWLKKGHIDWADDQQHHQFSLENMTAHISREKEDWSLVLPETHITLDQHAWPEGSLALAWIDGADMHNSPEIRLRATHLIIENLAPLMRIAGHFVPRINDAWHALQPAGEIQAVAVDIPINAPETSRVLGFWHDLRWQQWEMLPGGEHFSGSLAGSLSAGHMTANMTDGKMPYTGVFRAPLEIAEGKATLAWKHDDQGFALVGKDIDVRATAVWAKGGFRYIQPAHGEPWLGILAGIRTDNGGEAWRYFPENLMGKDLTDYLSGAIQGGKADNATLVFGGNPRRFPFYHNEGQFQVYVPLHHAIFAFQPDWPALKDFDITLNFVNQGLWMNSDTVNLGGVTATGLEANIPDYSQEKLLINADIHGPGEDVGPYFKQTPLQHTLAAALDELKLSGDVNARLHLDIPLDGERTQAQGQVMLKGNTLRIQPLGSTLSDLTGTFDFRNGDLVSGPLQATWFSQPVALSFSTREQEKSYDIHVHLNGDWQAAKTDFLPTQVASRSGGNAVWESEVGITLPYTGGAQYKANVKGNLKNVSSHLPSPLNKVSGTVLPVDINVDGNLKSFTLKGSAGSSRFASRWLLNKTLALEGAVWSVGKAMPARVPPSQQIVLNLPPVAGEGWLALFRQSGGENGTSLPVSLPNTLTLHTPALTLGGQQWNDLTLISEKTLGGREIRADGREIKADLFMKNQAPWRVNIGYLYYNPVQHSGGEQSGSGTLFSAPTISFRGLPDLMVRCAECWFLGQRYGRVDGDFTLTGDTLHLRNGLIDSGVARLTAEGEWVNRATGMRTSLKGTLKGQKMEQAANFFNFSSPLQGSSFNVDYDLHWRNAPWHPDEATLSGILHAKLGEGRIEDVDTGRAGQLLRLLSFDALLRKMRLDFSDAFGRGFYYDSIKGTAWIDEGILHTDDTLIDGLEADIALKGQINLVRRELAMEAIVAPEISATVSVATAFAVNPIIGAAVFAASKVLSPLWSKISVLRYSITGPMDKPRVDEVLRQPRMSDAPTH